MRASLGRRKPTARGVVITAHPASRPRIAWRDSTNRYNQRTILACLVPPRICMVHQAYYLFPSVPSPRAEAYLLGVMSSIPYDWFARRSIERNRLIVQQRHPVDEFRIRGL